MNRKPWPSDSADEYDRIVEGAGRLVGLVYLLRNRAVFGVRNTVLLESLFGLIPGELALVRHYCVIANRKRGWYKGGRYPRWVVAALEDGVGLADKILDGVGMMEDAYKKGNWCLVEELTRLVYDDVLKLEGMVQSGPPPEVVNSEKYYNELRKGTNKCYF